MHIVREPSRELKRLATRVDFALGQLIKARAHAGLETPWEALRHCWTLTNLTLRHSEAVTLMARTDVVLAPAAWASARAAMDSAARTTWLLAGSDEWEREARWLALMDEGLRIQNHIDEAFERGRGISDDLADFIRAVKAKLPTGTAIPRRIPPVADMLSHAGGKLDILYRLGSQYTHGTDYAALVYRRGLGLNATYGEDLSEWRWTVPLWIAWKALRTSVLELMASSGVSLDFDLDRVDAAVQEALDSFDLKIKNEATADERRPSEGDLARRVRDLRPAAWG